MGKLTNATKSHKIFIAGSSTKFRDSIQLNENNSFTYIGKLKNPGIIMLSTENSYFTPIWVNSGDVNILIKEDVYFNNGKPFSKFYLNIDSIQGHFETNTFQYISKTRDRLSNKYQIREFNPNDSVMLQLSPIIVDFVEKNSNSFLSPFLTRMFSIPLQEKTRLLNLMKNNTNYSEKEFLVDEIEVKKSGVLEIGKVVENLKIKNIKGNSFELYSVKKPFILIHFWSSSCVPCRSENPELVKIYSKYSSTKLEIVGVSVDISKPEWLKAVQNDKLPWINVSDLKGLEDIVAKKYLIDKMGLPFSILLDSSYKVLKTGLVPLQLMEILEDK